MFFVLALGLLLAALLIPIVAKILIRIDYLFIALLVWMFVFGGNGFVDVALLYGRDVHTVFILLTIAAAGFIWFGLQQIKIIIVYPFRILACALSAFLIVYLLSTGLLGSRVQEGMDIIWQWAIGIAYFILLMVLRSRDDDLLDL